MEPPSFSWAAAYLAIILTTVSLLLLKTLSGHRKPKHNLPPGPKPWPIIGNLNLIGPLPHRSVHALAQQYGPLMHLRLGSRHVVVGSSIDTAKLFLKTHDADFADRPNNAAGRLTNYDRVDLIWAPYGDYWRMLRRLCLTELFAAKRLDSFGYIRADEARLLMRDVSESAGAPIAIKDYASKASLGIICREVLGKKYAGEAGEELKWMVHEWFVLNGVYNVGDAIPWLQPLDLQGYLERMKKLSKMFDRFLERVIAEHNERRKGVGFEATDMVDTLLQLLDDPDIRAAGFTLDSVKGVTLDLLVAGTQSSAESLEWAIFELIKHPESMAKAIEELDRVVGPERLVEEKDFPSLPYLEAVLKETMRVHTPTPLTGRVCRRDTTVAGYHIPAGTQVLVNLLSITRDPAIWDAPDEFRPERFIGDGRVIDLKGQDFELLPFGSGRRMCPGYSHGLRVVGLSLANLLHCFAWTLPDGVTKEDLSDEEVHGLTVPKKVPLQIVARPKLHAGIYQE